MFRATALGAQCCQNVVASRGCHVVAKTSHNPTHWGLGDQAPQKHVVTTLARGKRSATLRKNAWFIGNTDKAHQEQPVHCSHGQRPPRGPPHQRGTGHPHHHSSRVEPTMVNGTSPEAVTTADREREPNTWWVPNSRGLWQPSQQAYSREGVGGTKLKLYARPWNHQPYAKPSPCRVVTNTHPSEHV